MRYIWGLLVVAFSLVSMTYATPSLVTLEDFLVAYVDHFDDDVPDSYQYIQLYFNNIETESNLYPILQKAVYLDMIVNKPIELNPSLLITQNSLAQVLQAHRGQDVSGSDEYVDELELAAFIDELPTYRAYYCSVDETPTYTIDMTDFALTEVENFAIMDDVYKRLTSQYLYRDQLENTDLVAGAIQGMVDVVGEEYTTYFLPAETESLQVGLGSEYSGIGVVIEPTDQGLKVVSPFQSSPAKKAGIQPDDVITHVDGTDITNMGADAADLIMGPVGESVQLTVVRDGVIHEIEIVRAVVQIDMVTDKMLDNGDYYIGLMNFGFGVAADMQAALQRYQLSGAADLIIDMRHNPGGAVSELETILDMFFAAGTDTFTMRRGTGSDYVHTTQKTDLTIGSDVDIVILVDSGSASAAEMLALILQDHERATIVGETTFGKGTAQSIVDYSDGSSFKYTIYERYSTLSQTSINHDGVTPDYHIALDKERLEGGYDNQLEYAKEM